MAKTFGQMVAEARSEVEVLSPQDAQARMLQNPNALVLDVRQADDLGDAYIPGALDIPLGVLPIRPNPRTAEGGDRRAAARPQPAGDRHLRRRRPGGARRKNVEGYGLQQCRYG